MRRMSFALTTEAVVERRKSVTRRLGWAFLKVGDLLLAVDKLRTKTARKLAVIAVVSVREEPLWDISAEDVVREGFPDMPPMAFVEMFMRHMGTSAATPVRRIEFRYREDLWDLHHSPAAKKLRALVERSLADGEFLAGTVFPADRSGWATFSVK